MLAIYYDILPYLIASSFYSILSIPILIVLCIVLYHIQAYEPIFILVACIIYIVSMSHTVRFNIACGYSLPELDSTLLYALTVCMELVSLAGSAHICETRLLPSSHIVNEEQLSAFLSGYCSGLLVFPHCLTHYPPVTRTLYLTSLSFSRYSLQ